MLCKMNNKFRLYCARKPLHIYDEEEEREKDSAKKRKSVYLLFIRNFYHLRTLTRQLSSTKSAVYIPVKALVSSEPGKNRQLQTMC